jgi:8-oxo-dGTP diphosphatase
MPQTTNNPRVGIGVLVWKDGKILMGQRLGSHGANTWSVPGGHLEFGESWEECAEREVFEEAGINIANPRFLAATNDLFPHENKHYTTIWMEGEWLKGEPTITEPDKWINMQWREMTELPSPLFEPCWENLKKVKPELFS